MLWNWLGREHVLFGFCFDLVFTQAKKKYFGRNPMEIECVQSGNYKKEAEKNVKSPSREILVRFWNKSNGNWMVLESGQSRGAAKLALATSWIDLRKVCQCKSSFWHTAGGIELSHGGLQCIFTMLAADEEKLPALEGFGSPTIIYDSRGTWLEHTHKNTEILDA